MVVEETGSERQAEKGRRFAALHESGTFVIPNPWDAGSAKAFEGLGFEALATTSSGFAFTLGRPDGGVTLEEVCAHAAALDGASGLPISVDLENGHGDEPEAAAGAILAAAAAGAVGGSIEDYDPVGDRIYEREEAIERVAAAVEAARSLPFPFMLTARAENLIRENPDLDDTIERLQAYERVGADVLYAPGLRDIEQVAALCAAVAAPVNVLAHRGLELQALAEAGVRRVSVGGSLAWSALSGAVKAARTIAEDGSFEHLGRPPAELDRWLGGK